MRNALFTILFVFSVNTAFSAVQIKTLARLAELQENPLTGYGLVTGLAGSGDTRRSKDTMVAIANVLQNFGVNIQPEEVNSRNAATVIITANLPAFAHSGDRIDVHVSSIGDARSLLGGVLLAAPLKGADNRIYALAQGAISLGGFKYDAFGSVVQKNHPTTGLISNGAVVEETIYNELIDKRGQINLVLNRPDFTTAKRITALLNERYGANTAKAESAQEICIQLPKSANHHLINFISEVENMELVPGRIPTIVVNERTGVVVAGAEVRIDPVTISEGNLKLSIATNYQVSQPGLVSEVGSAIATKVVPSTQIMTEESIAKVVSFNESSTIAELIEALAQVRASTRDVISILESLKRAGALQAELIIQ